MGATALLVPFHVTDIMTLRLLCRCDGDAKLMSFYYSSYSWAEKVRVFGRHGRARQFTAISVYYITPSRKLVGREFTDLVVLSMH